MPDVSGATVCQLSLGQTLVAELLTDFEHAVLAAAAVLVVGLVVPAVGVGLLLPPEPPPHPISRNVSRSILGIIRRSLPRQ